MCRTLYCHTLMRIQKSGSASLYMCACQCDVPTVSDLTPVSLPESCINGGVVCLWCVCQTEAENLFLVWNLTNDNTVQLYLAIKKMKQTNLCKVNIACETKSTLCEKVLKWYNYEQLQKD